MVRKPISEKGKVMSFASEQKREKQEMRTELKDNINKLKEVEDKVERCLHIEKMTEYYPDNKRIKCLKEELEVIGKAINILVKIDALPFLF